MKNLIYSGTYFLRICLIHFLRNIFEKEDYIPEEFRYNPDENLTKIRIKGVYSIEEKRLPGIYIGSIIEENVPAFLGENIKEEIIINNEPYFGKINPIFHYYATEILVSDFNSVSAEQLQSLVNLVFSLKKNKIKLMEDYGLCLDPAFPVRTSAPRISLIPGANVNEYSYIISFRVFWQGEYFITEEIETIADELIKIERVV